MDTKAVLQQEARFADAVYSQYRESLAIAPDMFRLYSNPTAMWDLRQAAAARLCGLKGKALLDMGCGMGEESVYFAKLGAEVTSIDISPVGVELTQKRAEFNGVGDRVRVFNMRADQTGFADHSFDIVHGLGILHHIGLEEGIREIVRLLRPGGKAVFLEHVGNSALVDKLKPVLYGTQQYKAQYTETEKPLRLADIQLSLQRFPVHEIIPYYLLFRLRGKWPFFRRDIVRKFDHRALHLCGPLKHFCGAALIYFEV